MSTAPNARRTIYTWMVRPLMTTANSQPCLENSSAWDHGPSFCLSSNSVSYSTILHDLTRIRFSDQEAQRHWGNIVRHEKSLSKLIGRDVGISTAACDYLVNIAGVLSEPRIIPLHVLLDKENCIIRDDLTGLYNRRYFNRELPTEIERYARFGTSFSLVMLDLDHFKNFNDTYGHAAGDVAIKSTADVIYSNARLYDRVVRYGGEEFTAILPQTNKSEAVVVAERIRCAVQESQIVFSGRHLGALTVSAGVSTFPLDALSMEQLVQNADQALYKAKSDRNRVAVYEDTKREHPRLPLHAPVKVLSFEDSAPTPLGLAKNISAGGLLCESSKSIPRKPSLAIVIEDGLRSVSMRLNADVVRVTDAGKGNYHLGVSFRIDSDEMKEDLMRLIISLSNPIR